MAPRVTFPDVSELVVDHLTVALPAEGETAVVRSRVPKDRPARFVLVRRAGGTRLNLVADDAQVTVECWAATESAAMDLAQLVRGFVNAMRGTSQGGVAVYRVVELAGPALLPDPLSNQPRATFTVQIAARGA